MREGFYPDPSIWTDEQLVEQVHHHLDMAQGRAPMTASLTTTDCWQMYDILVAEQAKRIEASHA